MRIRITQKAKGKREGGREEGRKEGRKKERKKERERKGGEKNKTENWWHLLNPPIHLCLKRDTLEIFHCVNNKSTLLLLFLQIILNCHPGNFMLWSLDYYFIGTTDCSSLNTPWYLCLYILHMLVPPLRCPFLPHPPGQYLQSLSLSSSVISSGKPAVESSFSSASRVFYTYLYHSNDLEIPVDCNYSSA